LQNCLKMWRCPYLHAKNLKYTNINLLKYCKEQDLEIVAVNLKLFCKNVIILCIYRSPGGNLVYFLDQLDSILNSLENLKTEFIICGDFNINYIRVNNKKTQLENLLNMYNLTSTVNFPTRITTTSCSAIGNIFVDKRRKYTIKPYTECPRRNVQYFGRVFLMLNYTDITQNTYIQS